MAYPALNVPLQFYYPAQTRGVNSAGQPERFAMCGLLEGGGQAHTVCGSLSQENNGFYLQGQQTDKGSSNWADPLGFGTANQPTLTLTPLDQCTPEPEPEPEPASPSKKSSHGLAHTPTAMELALVLVFLTGAA
jgi:hypothetical protein